MSTGRAQQDGVSVCKFISGSRTQPERAEIHTPHVGYRAPSALGVTAERNTSLLIIIAQLRAVQEDSEKTGSSRRQGLGAGMRNVSECGALPWCFCALKSWGVPPLWGPLWKVCKKWAFHLVVCSPASNTAPPTGRRPAGLRAPCSTHPCVHGCVFTTRGPGGLLPGNAQGRPSPLQSTSLLDTLGCVALSRRVSFGGPKSLQMTFTYFL